MGHSSLVVQSQGKDTSTPGCSTSLHIPPELIVQTCRDMASRCRPQHRMGPRHFSGFIFEVKMKLMLSKSNLTLSQFNRRCPVTCEHYASVSRQSHTKHPTIVLLYHLTRLNQRNQLFVTRNSSGAQRQRLCCFSMVGVSLSTVKMSMFIQFVELRQTQHRLEVGPLNCVTVGGTA